MTSTLRLTLLADGRSDACLLSLLRWLVGEVMGEVQIEPVFADLAAMREPPKSLSERIRAALELYPCDLLFVHRDAEAQTVEARIGEIQRAMGAIMAAGHWVPVVPVRMTEAWLLVDERAIREAAANPSGKIALGLPPLSRLEALPSPKEALRSALEIASERTGRRLLQFRRDMGQHVQRVAQLMHEREKLRELPAFLRLEKDTRSALDAWASSRKGAR
jgi:hypothetical protein